MLNVEIKTKCNSFLKTFYQSREKVTKVIASRSCDVSTTTYAYSQF